MKRPRGRPRKNPVVAATTDSEEVKRLRGRPKKVEIVDNNIEPVSPLPKPRGRPRKQAVASADEAEKTNETTVKKPKADEMLAEDLKTLKASIRALGKKYNLGNNEMNKLTSQDVTDSWEIARYEEIANM